MCYATDTSTRSYRVVQDKVRWDVLPGLACKHVAVLPALQRPAASSSVALPSLPLHLLLDIANRADVDLVLHIDAVDLTNQASSDRGTPHRAPHPFTTNCRMSHLTCVRSSASFVAASTHKNATCIRRRSDRR